MIRAAILAVVSFCLVIAVGCGGGGSGATTPVPPTAPASDFSLAVQPASLWLMTGSSSQIQITLTPINGFTGTASLNANSLPSGVTVSPTLPQNIGPSGLSLSIAAAAGATAGSFTVSLSASSGNLQHSSNLALTLAAPQAGTIPGNRTDWVRLGSNPIAVYYDAPRNHVLASLPAVNRVDVIDASTGNLLSSVPVSVANNEPNGACG